MPLKPLSSAGAEERYEWSEIGIDFEMSIRHSSRNIEVVVGYTRLNKERDLSHR